MNPPSNCKCCNTSTIEYLGSIDANKACWDRYGTRAFPVSEEMIPYYLCKNCGFIFTNYMDLWSPDEFKSKIYNKDYLPKVNPLLPEDVGRPLEQTNNYGVGRHLALLLEGSEKLIRILDYGAGAKVSDAGQCLVDMGFNYTSYEPYLSDSKTLVEGQYDFIFAIEVVEHCHNLDDLTSFIKSHLSPCGIFYIQTLIHPFPTPEGIINSWYISPRDGHISIFSFEALAALFRRANLNLVKTLYGLVAFKNLPNFPNKFFV